jgi:acetyl-CoA carboxylase carboxyl transferase subunit alpha
MGTLLKRGLADALRQFQDVKPAELVKLRQERLAGYGKFKEITG